MKIFDILDALTINKSDLDFNDAEVKKIYNQFLVNKFLSMSEFLVPYVEQASVMIMSDEMHFIYLRSILPKRKFYYKFIKPSNKINEDNKYYISDYFEIGTRDIDGFADTIDDSEVDYILSKYMYGTNNQITL